MNIILATNIDHNYWNTKHHGFIDSVVKHARKNRIILMLMDDGTAGGPLPGYNLPSKIEIVTIDINSINYSRHANLKSSFPDRPNYICLESGEFVDFINFNDNDILILCDWDVIMQRGFTENELKIINNLGAMEFGQCRDHYDDKKSTRIYREGNLLHGYLEMNKIFNDISKDWIIYQAGVQVARISAWRRLYEYWKELAPKMYKYNREHFAGQGLFNYIIQKFNMVKELPPSFHNGDWFPGTPARIINNSLYVNVDPLGTGGNEKVLFNHHNWKSLPVF